MNVTCSAQGCPILLNSLCVIYEGESLLYTGITTNDTLQTALQKIDAKFHDAGLGYIFTNGLTQTVGQPVKLGGSLVENTTITNNSYYLQFTGTVKAATFVTTGGTNVQFVKGDGSLDNTSYQTAGAYITALSGDASATGPGNAIVTLATVNTNVGTFGTATTVPTITVNAKGLVTSITSTAINIPWPLLTYTGDISGVGYPGTQITLTLPSVNPNAITSSGILKLTVNNKGLVTSAVTASNLDIFNVMGFTPVPPTRTITINGVTQDLGVNRSWNVGTVTSVNATAGTSIGVSVTDPTGAPNITITNLAPDVPITLTPGFGINVTGIYPNFTIINTNPSTSGGTVTSVNMTVPTGFTISGNPITSSGTFALAMASGYSIPTTVSQTNWNTAYTFVNNFPSQSGNVGKYLTTDGSNLSWATVTGGISGSGTAGQITYWSGTSAVTGSSNLFWDNTNGRLGIGTSSPAQRLDVSGTINVVTNDSGDAFLISNRGFAVFRDTTNTITNRFRGASGGFIFQDASFNTKTQISTNNGLTYFNNGGGNVAIGTTTDNGQRLQVIGSMRVGTTAASAMYWDDTNNRLGIGTSSPTSTLVVNGKSEFNSDLRINGSNSSNNQNALGVYDVSNNVLFKVANGGRIYLGNSTTYLMTADGNGSYLYGGSNYQIASTSTGITFGALQMWGDNVINTSGLHGHFGIKTAFAPTSGSGQFAAINIISTINQTGAANGITRGLYVNPTLTVAADWRSIEWANNTGYGIYGVGTANNYVAGNFGFQQTSPTAIADFGASTTSKASLRIRSGTAPTTPNDGDIWFTGTDLKIQIGGVTKTFTII